jgi:1-acyl-sn-glycerol-3-phosphate acyltransferase
MQSAIDAQCLLQPVAIRYPDRHNNIVHASVSYTGEISFMQSVKNVISAKGIEAELYFLEPINACNKSRDELARYAEAQIKTLFTSAG